MVERVGKAGKTLWWASAASFVVALAIMGAFAWTLLIYPQIPAKARGERLVLIPASQGNATELASTLQSNGIIDNGSMFTIYMKLLGADRGFREHKVTYEGGLTPREVALRSAAALGVMQVWVTLPEGYTRFDIAKRLEEYGVCAARDFLNATEDGDVLESLAIEAPTAEGYLFPDTYQLTDAMEPRRVIGRLVENWQRRVQALVGEDRTPLDVLRADLGWDIHDVVTLASIIEKEAAVPEERPIIAGVFLNRLRSKTFLPAGRLQADPTVAYGCLVKGDLVASCDGFNGTITRAMLEDDANPFNTYRHPGLPPGPICNPGAAALEAVLRPREHDFLYFVSQGNGRHAFSATLGEHNRAVERFIRTDRP